MEALSSVLERVLYKCLVSLVCRNVYNLFSFISYSTFLYKQTVFSRFLLPKGSFVEFSKIGEEKSHLIGSMSFLIRCF